MGHRSSRCRVDPSRRLADVEIQCVLRCLPLADLLRFARCNRRMMHAADSPFAFELTRLHIDVFKCARPSGGLWLHAPLQLELKPSGSASAAELDAQLSATVSQLRVSVVQELDAATWFSTSTEQMTQLLSQPCLAKLTKLRLAQDGVRGAAVPAILSIIAGFSSLESLTIVSPIGPSDQWAPLAGLASLTDLCFTDTDITVDRSYLPVVSTFPALRRLSVQRPALYGSRLREVFGTPSMQRLESLKLEQWYAGGFGDAPPVPDKDLRAVFAGLQQLRVLHLAYVYEPDRVLRVLHTARSLQQLILRPSGDPYTVREGHGSPSQDALNSVLALSPQLDLSLLVPLVADYTPRDSHENFSFRLLTELQAWARGLDAHTAKRLHIHSWNT